MRIGHEQHIAVLDVVGILHIVAGHGLREDTFRHLHVAEAELPGRHDLAPRRACHVGHKGLDVLYLAFLEPGLENILLIHVTPVAG